MDGDADARGPIQADSAGCKAARGEAAESCAGRLATRLRAAAAAGADGRADGDKEAGRGGGEGLGRMVGCYSWGTGGGWQGGQASAEEGQGADAAGGCGMAERDRGER